MFLAHILKHMMFPKENSGTKNKDADAAHNSLGRKRIATSNNHQSCSAALSIDERNKKNLNKISNGFYIMICLNLN